MSQVFIRSALERALETGLPSIMMAVENQSFTPPGPAVPYQQVYLRFATPENIEVGAGYNEIGFMQVSLFYPQGDGSLDATTRAKAIRDFFKKGSSFVSNGVTVTITKTPEISGGNPDGDRWAVVIKIPFMAQIYS